MNAHARSRIATSRFTCERIITDFCAASANDRSLRTRNLRTEEFFKIITITIILLRLFFFFFSRADRIERWTNECRVPHDSKFRGKTGLVFRLVGLRPNPHGSSQFHGRCVSMEQGVSIPRGKMERVPTTIEVEMSRDRWICEEWN